MTKYIEAVSAATIIAEKRGIPIADLVDTFAEIPAADVAPVRHGRWIEQEKYTFGVMYDCSICGDRILDNGHYNGHSWNYCPNCGAKMDGDMNE